MTFVREGDLLRPELLTTGAGVITVWPKVDGANVQASAAGFVVYKPDGTTSLQTGAPTPTDVEQGNRTVSRIDCAVSAIATPDEDYQLRVQWTYGGSVYDEIVLFDVCLAPLGSLLSLSDLLELKPDVGDDLERYARRLGYPTGQEGQEAAAGICVTQARQEVQSRLQARAREAEEIRPHMMLDRRAVAAVERYFALAAVYEGLGGTTDDLDEQPAALALKHWLRRAEGAWVNLRVKYMAHDATDSSPAGRTHFGRAFQMERS